MFSTVHSTHFYFENVREWSSKCCPLFLSLCRVWQVFFQQGYGVLAAVASAAKVKPVILLREQSYALQFMPRAAPKIVYGMPSIDAEQTIRNLCCAMSMPTPDLDFSHRKASARFYKTTHASASDNPSLGLVQTLPSQSHRPLSSVMCLVLFFRSDRRRWSYAIRVLSLTS